MNLNTGAIVWAVALVSAASYIVCAAFVADSPAREAPLRDPS